MYLDASSPERPGDTGGDLRARLWSRVRSAFPDAAGTHARLEEGGGDHLLLIVDEERAFRFPRPGRHGPAREIRVLRRLAPLARIAVPAYDLVDPDGRFASYRLIPGVPLTPARFAAMPPAAGRAAIADAVDLLAQLHALDPATIERPGAWPRMWTARRFADRLLDERLPLLAARVPALAAPAARFLRRHRDDSPPRTVVVHGDMAPEHLLLDRQADRLAGIIDFADVALGDPAHDLAGFWAYGAAAAAHAVARHGRADDPALATRARRHHLRYRLDRLYEAIGDGAGAEAIGRRGAALAASLAAEG